MQPPHPKTLTLQQQAPSSLPLKEDAMSLPPSAIRIGIIGLGYVGLPLAVYLARHFPVIGFDIDRERVAELKRGLDRTREVTD
jgi:UDP-N-acetyl-D-mannosaminuronate dehydrogenase